MNKIGNPTKAAGLVWPTVGNRQLFLPVPGALSVARQDLGRQV